MSQFDKKFRKQTKIAMSDDLDWSFERPTELVVKEGDTVNSLLMTIKLHFNWFSQRWTLLSEDHQVALLNLFHDHPQMLTHIYKALSKNFDKEGKPVKGHWVLEQMEFVLFEKLGLLNDDVEVEIYRIKPEETDNV